MNASHENSTTTVPLVGGASPWYRRLCLAYCFLVAAVLLGAAAMSVLFPDRSWPGWYKGLSLGFSFAAAAGVVMLRHVRAGVAMGAGAFALLAVVAAGNWAMGHTSCGCFGAIRVPPAVTAAANACLALLGGALLTHPVNGPVTQYGPDTHTPKGVRWA